mmetsp:Transcript_3406/g.6363  ORF Transcript_3406/g.6363 Transcript_3406/m.6363 type:complete len:293 (+) Transcript_3406:330-1208(+)
MASVSTAMAASSLSLAWSIAVGRLGAAALGPGQLFRSAGAGNSLLQDFRARRALSSMAWLGTVVETAGQRLVAGLLAPVRNMPVSHVRRQRSCRAAHCGALVAQTRQPSPTDFITPELTRFFNSNFSIRTPEVPRHHAAPTHLPDDHVALAAFGVVAGLFAPVAALEQPIAWLAARPDGIGALLSQLQSRERDGLLARTRLRPLPRLPRAVSARPSVALSPALVFPARKSLPAHASARILLLPVSLVDDSRPTLSLRVRIFPAKTHLSLEVFAVPTRARVARFLTLVVEAAQ